MTDSAAPNAPIFMPLVGESYRLFYADGHTANKVIHIRSVIDDEYVVYRFWGKGSWVYKLEHVVWFEVVRDRLTRVKGAANNKGDGG